jgi:hypothetical protein
MDVLKVDENYVSRFPVSMASQAPLPVGSKLPLTDWFMKGAMAAWLRSWPNHQSGDSIELEKIELMVARRIRIKVVARRRYDGRFLLA